MSKKQIDKKKLSLKLISGETAVVLSYDTFMHIAETYDYLATQQEEADHREGYYEIADAIRYQSNSNYFEGSEHEDDQW